MIIVISICFAVAFVVILFLGRIHENLWLESKYDDKEINRTFMIRLLIVAAAAMAIPLGVFRQMSENSIWEPLELRVIVSLILFIIFGLSFYSSWFKRYLEVISQLTMGMLSIFLIFMAYKNNFDPAYFIDVLIIVSASPILYRNFKNLILYLLIYWYAILIAYVLLSDPLLQKETYYISIAIATSVSIIIMKATKSLEKQLVRAFQIIKSTNLLIIETDHSDNIITSNLAANKFNEEYTIKSNSGSNVIVEFRGKSDNVSKKYEDESKNIKWIFWQKITSPFYKINIGLDITEQKETELKILSQTKEIQDSINYAKSIQQSALPTRKEIEERFAEHLIFYRPKDTLSGDFYVVDQIRTNDHKIMPMFFLGDCTGHGIPGSILSILSISLIKESFTKASVNSPAEAMDYVRSKIIEFFRSNAEAHMHEGMDGSYGVVNPYSNQLYYAGANSSCYIIRRGELIETKGCPFHVGFDTGELTPFTNRVIELEKDDCIYFTSDGYTDQFEATNKRKFSKRRFRELILAIHTYPFEEQEKIFEKTFDEWKQDVPQTDDVSVFGFKHIPAS